VRVGSVLPLVTESSLSAPLMGLLAGWGKFQEERGATGAVVRSLIKQAHSRNTRVLGQTASKLFGYSSRWRKAYVAIAHSQFTIHTYRSEV